VKKLVFLFAVAGVVCLDTKGMQRDHPCGAPVPLPSRSLLRNRESLASFDPYSSRAWNEIEVYFGRNVKFRELLSIVNVILPVLPDVIPGEKLKLPRKAKRSFASLVKFVDKNLNALSPYFSRVALKA
jgi:hypothetical protein